MIDTQNYFLGKILNVWKAGVKKDLVNLLVSVMKKLENKTF